MESRSGNDSSRALFVTEQWVAYIGAAQNTTAQYGVGGVKGIDFFANLVRHEEQHRLDFNAWWYKEITEPVRDNTGAITGYVTRRVPTDIIDARDTDHDSVPNEVEEDSIAPGTTEKYNPNKFFTFPDDDSYGQGWSDSEHHAKKSQPKWGRGGADREDWGAPGRQYKTPAYDD